MDDIDYCIANIWNERLKQCIKEHDYTQKTFAKAFREKYDSGTQANISRWVRVGQRTTNGTIGFPSYENMKRIADFFGVTVGYLTGETDYESFEMERSCSYLGLTETSGQTVRRITKGAGTRNFQVFLSKNYGATLNYLISSADFEAFIEAITNVAVSIKQQQSPVEHFEEACKKIDPELLPLAIKCRDYTEGDNDEDYPTPTPELAEAINILDDAEKNDMEQPYILDRNVKVEKYNLQEIYLKLIEDTLCDAHLDSMTDRLIIKPLSVQKLKILINNTLTRSVYEV